MKTSSISSLILAVIFAAGTAFGGTGLGFEPADTVKTVVERQTGQSVELRLKSGEKIAGKVAKVGEKAIQLVEISGQEFFEALVLIDDVSVVVVRAPSK
jgi:hypothetical protein